MSNPSLGASQPLALPLYLSSVYAIPDLDALDSISDSREAGFIYARDDHPNAQALGNELAQLEGAAWGLICGSGMAALTLAVLGSVQQGDRVVASSYLYGRTAALLRQELARFGVRTDFVDTCNLSAVSDALREPARLVICETISNPLLRIADLPALCELAHKNAARLLVDNTFASPALCQPLNLGADLVMESLTKMIGGHSDLTLGLLCGRDTSDVERLRSIRSIWGLSASPFDCWLASRGLATLDLRMRAASRNAAALADFLAQRAEVRRVIYPRRADHPDAVLGARLLPGGAGNMLCFELAGREAVNRFLRAGGIPLSPSLGDVRTTCSHPATTSHRYVSALEKEQQGITDGLVRLSVGIEAVDQIVETLSAGLSATA